MRYREGARRVDLDREAATTASVTDMAAAMNALAVLGATNTSSPERETRVKLCYS